MNSNDEASKNSWTWLFLLLSLFFCVCSWYFRGEMEKWRHECYLAQAEIMRLRPELRKAYIDLMKLENEQVPEELRGVTLTGR